MSTYSKEHIHFLKKKKHQKRIILIGRCLIFFLFLILWEELSNHSILNPFLYSSPSRIFHTLFALLQTGELLKHIQYTVFEVFISFSITMILGILISFLLWRFPIFSKIIDPYITILNSLPKVAFGPLIIIWVGAGFNSILLMAIFISLFTTILSLYTGFLSVPENYFILMKSFGAKPFTIFQKVIFPYNYDTLFSTLKINASMCFIGVIMGELLVSKYGLGYLIMYGSQIFQLDFVLTSIFVLGILSYMFYFIIDFTTKKIQKKKS